eukprot:GHRQ01027022.1.p1 GENE.GHRQ01027022.1~~GHRQ01027022.1.p1  ORF type:complete len:114 (+),score=25.42 GHRQ01027022.1:390-731(+)
MLQRAAHTPWRTCSTLPGALSTIAVQQQRHLHHWLCSRRQQTQQQRIRAQGRDGDDPNDMLMKTHGSVLDGQLDVAPPTVTAMLDTESLLQQLDSLKRWVHDLGCSLKKASCN